MNNQDSLSRPIKTIKQFTTPHWERTWRDDKALIEAADFLKLIEYLYGPKLDRQTLQLYSSPRFKILPPPVHKGGHVSYYLNPEHTERMGVILHLRDKLRLPLASIRAILKDFPTEYYHLIMNGVLTGTELLDFPALLKAGYQVRDLIYYEIAKLLAMMDKEYWDLVGREGYQAPLEIERAFQQGFTKQLKDLAGWLRTDCRIKMFSLIQTEWQRRRLTNEDAA